jgi:Xaa-Pro dipeptidase
MDGMYQKLTKQELQQRLARFYQAMNVANPEWNTAIILSKVNQYYLTGTMQDGMLLLKKDDGARYFVRRSYERAKDESPFEPILPMESYRDAAQAAGVQCGETYIETEVATIAILGRLKRHFQMDSVKSLDRVMLSLRSVKSPYELDWMRRSGERHNDFLRNLAPGLLREGMSEADFVADLYASMVKHGYQGISRFSVFQTEMVIGQVAFGESALYPTCFDGPGGAYGMCPAVPLVGRRERKLKKGDLVFVDIAFGINGYHTDKTQVYQFGGRALR